MRHLSAIILLAASWLAIAGNRATAEIDWHEGRAWDEVKAMAKQANKPIFIDFYATWCGPCKMLDRQVYNNAEVVSELGKTVPYKVDVDKPAGRPLAQLFGVSSMPTLVLCSADGKEVDRFLGFRPAPEFLRTLRGMLDGGGSQVELEKRLAKSPDDPELMVRLADKLGDRGQPDRARTLLERAVELDPDNGRGAAVPALRSLIKLSHGAGDLDGAIRYARRLLAGYPAAADSSEVLRMIAGIQYRKGDLAGMLETGYLLVRRQPNDLNTLHTFAWNAAKAGMALERATDAALKAVVLSDEDPGVIDTLAEVYHARGMHGEAVAWIKKALAKEPHDRYLQDQLAKFEQAAREAKP